MLLRLPLFRLFPLLLVGLVYHANAQQQQISGTSLYPEELIPLITRADALLTAGQFNDAAKAYSEAIEGAPEYLLFYKRATAYYSAGRYSSALSDFEHVLTLTNDTFDKANLMKARIFTKEGRFADARDALRKYTTKVKGDSASQEVMMAITEGELASKKISQAIRAKLWQACVEAATTALSTASHSPKLRQQRADCSIAAGDIEGAVADLSRLAQLTTSTTQIWMKSARLGYFLFPYNNPTDPPSPAMSSLKQCMHYDPDSPKCLKMHRLVKAFDKSFKALDKALQSEDWRGILKLLLGSSPDGSDGFAAKFDEALKEHITRENLELHPQIQMPHPLRSSPRRAVILKALCRAHVKTGQAKKGEEWCGALLDMEGRENDGDGAIGVAEALFAKEEWEEAVRVLERAFEASGRQDREIHQRLVKAQKLLKQSRQKDYYKVLGVARDADTKAIKKAYRKAVLSAHPDKGGSEAKMAAVNEAYEVLSDPELRQRYDNGDDPNDPTSNQGGHPFQGGGFPGGFAQFFQQGFPGGGGFQFHYSPPGHH
ncbi:hypothetical protein DICSQDRAFT_88478 [Dichomitus squalens LYAD-421 SS1]|uniref:J domain-containing protein n=2 Tax=Dichomitus squalens TaxID=114155 RepID=A0A4Q9MRP5_9APHY|nr:uncharacterized protein DICSQDRAFT_88478 [Dichomitus squalens LYAD-421 SS1]EJF60015.1 hypothetical protein DICSQDRAFT_88478 [Dichomitus squalens LYAD-421 SS1]TBU29202.1 hypothetical protein BD311DRAFT_661770 [Dichomitus squalens]